MRLTESVIQKAKPAEKQYRLADGAGMYLFIRRIFKLIEK